MNAFLQRLQLLLRLLLSLWLLQALWPRSPGLAVLAAALLFWSYGLVMALCFARLAGLDPGPGLTRPRWPELLRAWWRELWICERIFAYRQPFAEHREPDHLPQGGAARGVLLLHGFSCNRGLWNVWMRRLRGRGHACVALSLEPAFGSIDAYAPQIEAAIRRLEQCTGTAPVIVAHSMGGLAVRAWWRAHGQAGRELRVHRIITLGSPHAGTLTAALSPVANARQMRRRSAWLCELSAAESLDWRQRFTCFFSRCDQVVCPAATALLPGAQPREIEGAGHLALVEQESVFAELLLQLAAPAPQEKSP